MRAIRAVVRGVVVTVAVAVAVALAPAGPAAAATAHQPILFVHGYNSNAATWNEMIASFEADGYTADELYAISYDWTASNVTTAGVVSTAVEQIRAATGWATIDLVSHSMGGLSSRYYLKNLGGTARIDDWVSLGGPNHGTNVSRFCFDTSCKEMRQGSPFLTALNTGDETPATVHYGTWKSPCDTVINPDSSVALIGARNTSTTCLSHGQLLSDDTVYGQVAAFLR